jgi:hypothetical protein
MRRLSLLPVLCATCVLVAIFLAPRSLTSVAGERAAPWADYASPQDVFNAYCQAIARKDDHTVICCLTPQAQLRGMALLIRDGAGVCEAATKVVTNSDSYIPRTGSLDCLRVQGDTAIGRASQVIYHDSNDAQARNNAGTGIPVTFRFRKMELGWRIDFARGHEAEPHEQCVPRRSLGTRNATDY